MAILLTGGCGYIGSHTAVELIENGYQVVIADNLCNSSAEVLNRIERITGKRPLFYQLDVRDHAALSRLFAEQSIEAVIHFAALKSVPTSVSEPLQYYCNNLDAVLTLLRVMEENGCRRIIFSSSATVYGDGIPPFRESDPTAVPTNPYGKTKLMTEQILTDLAAARPELSVVLLRYFNPIGAHVSGLIGEDPHGIPGNLFPYLTQVAVGRREYLSVFGNDYNTPDGTGVRDYIHVSDLADGHVRAVEYAFAHSGVEVFNLGLGFGYSVLELIAAFERVTGVAVPYRIAPRRVGDVDSCWSDPTKAQQVLGWCATRNVDDMCRDAWNWQQHNPDGYGSIL